MTRLLGAGIFCVFLFAALYAYRKENARRLSEYRGLCRLVGHISRSLSEIPIPLERIYADFEDAALSRTEFLTLLRRAGLATALTEGELHLTEEELSPFLSYAKELGMRLYAEERKEAARLSAEAEKRLSLMEAAMPQKQRLTITLTLTGGALLLLLLL